MRYVEVFFFFFKIWFDLGIGFILGLMMVTWLVVFCLDRYCFCLTGRGCPFDFIVEKVGAYIVFFVGA